MGYDFGSLRGLLGKAKELVKRKFIGESLHEQHPRIIHWMEDDQIDPALRKTSMMQSVIRGDLYDEDIFPSPSPTPALTVGSWDIELANYSYEHVSRICREIESRIAGRAFDSQSLSLILKSIQLEIESKLPELSAEVTIEYGQVKIVLRDKRNGSIWIPSDISGVSEPKEEKVMYNSPPGSLIFRTKEEMLALGLPLTNPVSSTIGPTQNRSTEVITVGGYEDWRGVKGLTGPLGEKTTFTTFDEAKSHFGMTEDESETPGALSIDFQANREARRKRNNASINSSAPESKAIDTVLSIAEKMNVKVSQIKPKMPTKEDALAKALNARRIFLEQSNNWSSGGKEATPIVKLKEKPKPRPEEMQSIEDLAVQNQFVQYETALNLTRKTISWKVGLMKEMDWTGFFETIFFRYNAENNLVTVVHFVDDDTDNVSGEKQVLSEYQINAKSALSSIKSYLAKGFDYNSRTKTDEAIAGLSSIYTPGSSQSMAIPKNETDVSDGRSFRSYTIGVKNFRNDRLKESLQQRESMDFDLAPSILEVEKKSDI